MKRVLITATPPTPNGQLHVGHLSGPYLAGDVFKRFCRLNGREAVYITGGDDNQSYVATKGAQLGLTPTQTADKFNDAIVDILRRAAIEVDVYVRPLHSARHREFVSDFVRRLYDAGHVVGKEVEAAWCGQCERYLYESYIGGICPHCHERCDGNACEACAEPNQCTDMLEATCKKCGSPAQKRTYKRLFFPLAPHAARLTDYFSRVAMGSHLAACCDRMLSKGLPDIPVSNLGDWGIPVPVPGYEGQTLYAWFEMGPGYLTGTNEMLAGMRRDGSWEDWWKGDGAEVVQFFGYDNAYFHTILFTSEMMAYDPAIRLPSAFVTNEFYRLEGLKFSTSRNHAIWGGAALDHLPADVLRYYLCLDRPETAQTNFRWADFRRGVHRDLTEGWQPWLLNLAGRVRAEHGGSAPAMSALSANEQRFAAEMGALVAAATESFQKESFSPRRVVGALNRLVDAARMFGEAESYWRREAVERRRNAAALELSAAATLAALAAPIMPAFAARLWSELGLGAAPGPGDWPSRPVPVPAGRQLAGMDTPYFTGIDAGCDALEAARPTAAAAAVAVPAAAVAVA
jgi:methionyl-tRNA synthetase